MAFSNLSGCAETEKNGACVGNYKARAIVHVHARMQPSPTSQKMIWTSETEECAPLLFVWAPGHVSFTLFSPAPTSKDDIRMCPDVIRFFLLLCYKCI